MGMFGSSWNNDGNYPSSGIAEYAVQTDGMGLIYRVLGEDCKTYGIYLFENKAQQRMLEIMKRYPNSSFMIDKEPIGDHD